MNEPRPKAKIILEKSVSKTGIPDIMTRLVSLKNDELQGLLVALSEQRSEKLKVTDVVKQSIESRFLNSAEAPLRAFIELDGLAISSLPDNFDTVELSPLAPFGSNSVLADLDQKNIVSTVRNTEVVADASPLLAIEYLKKRKNGHQGAYNVFTSQRVVRGQNYSVKGFIPHFRLMFCLSADKENKASTQIEQFVESHITFYLDTIYSLIKSGKYEVKKINVSISNLAITEALIKHYGMDREILMRNTASKEFSAFKEYNVDFPEWISIDQLPTPYLIRESLDKLGIANAYTFLMSHCSSVLARLSSSYPDVNFGFNFNRISGIGYYDDLCLNITAENEDGESYGLADGGFVNWTRQLLHSEKEVCFSSGFGSELFINKFRKK